MSQQQHTQEPWRISRRGNEVVGSNGLGDTVAMMVDCDSDEQTHANARRIVACVNACEGIQTNQLESVTGKLAISSSISMWQSYCDKKMQLEDAIEQRDTLLAALRTCDDGLALLDQDKFGAMRLMIRRAIASVKEKA